MATGYKALIASAVNGSPQLTRQIFEVAAEAIEELPKNPFGIPRDPPSLVDPIWGEIYFTSWEWFLLESRFMRRLKNISQLGLADLAFPGAIHTRYEHSCGVLAASDHIMRGYILRYRHIDLGHRRGKDVPTGYRQQQQRYRHLVRLAALVHDVGHVPFSHAAEPILEAAYHNEFRLLRRVLDGFFGSAHRASCSELIAVIFLLSPRFKEFIRRVPLTHRFASTEFSVLTIVSCVLGAGDWDHSNPFRYLINGSCDVDKVDYVLRDYYYLSECDRPIRATKRLMRAGLLNDCISNNNIGIVVECPPLGTVVRREPGLSSLKTHVLKLRQGMIQHIFKSRALLLIDAIALRSLYYYIRDSRSTLSQLFLADTERAVRNNLLQQAPSYKSPLSGTEMRHLVSWVGEVGRIEVAVRIFKRQDEKACQDLKLSEALLSREAALLVYDLPSIYVTEDAARRPLYERLELLSYIDRFERKVSELCNRVLASRGAFFDARKRYPRVQCFSFIFKALPLRGGGRKHNFDERKSDIPPYPEIADIYCFCEIGAASRYKRLVSACSYIWIASERNVDGAAVAIVPPRTKARYIKMISEILGIPCEIPESCTDAVTAPFNDERTTRMNAR